MKILVLNCGSSSIKYQLFEMTTKEVLAKGGIEKIGLPDSFIKFSLPNGEKKTLEEPIPEHTKGVELIFKVLTDPQYGALKSLDELDAVGHRMVHGGEKFSKSVILNDEVLKAFEACNDLAPLHNPANLKGVNAVTALLPNIPQVGVFDTAFHQTMPDYAYMYAIPYELYEKYGIRRYGFDGRLPRCCQRTVHGSEPLERIHPGYVLRRYRSSSLELSPRQRSRKRSAFPGIYFRSGKQTVCIR